MTSYEIVKAAFDGTRAPRIPVWDEIPAATRASWKRSGHAAAHEAEDYFGFDIACFGIDQSFGLGKDRITGSLKKEAAAFFDKIDFSAPALCTAQATIAAPLSRGAFAKAEEKKRAKAFCFFEPFGFAAWAIGEEALLYDLKRLPRIVVEALFERYTHALCAAFDALDKEGYRFDIAWAWGDIAYNKGLYFGEEFYREVLYKSHKKIFDFFKRRALHCIFHSDGNIEAALPLLKDAGVDAVHPLDVTSLDPRAIKKTYRGLVMFGGIDTQLLTRMDLEGLRRDLAVLKEKGMFIYSLSGPVPPQASWNDYGRFIDTVKEESKT
jgi:hypothetical protein